MLKPLLLLPFFLFAVLITQTPAAATQKPGQPRRAATKTAQAKPTQSKPAQAKSAETKPAQVKPAASKPAAMRLVVQQGLSRVSNGFIIFSPDGRLVATGDGGGDVVVWDVASGREVRRLTENTGDPGAQDVDGWLWGAFSPDSRLLATSVGPNLRLWDLWTGKRLWLGANADNAFFTPDDGGRPPVAFAPGARQIVVTGTQYKLTWDARTGRLLSRARHTKPGQELESFDLRPPRSAASPGGRFVARAKDGVVTVTEKTSGSEVGRARFLVLRPGRTSAYPGQEWHDELFALAVSPDGRVLATADDGDDDNTDHLIRLWDVKTGAQLRTLAGTHADSTRFRFTPAGGLLGLSSKYESYSAREMLGGREATWRAAARIVAKDGISPDARFVATGAGLAGEVWDAQTGERVARVEGRLDPGEEPGEAEWAFVGFTPLDTVTFYRDSAYGEPQTVTLGTRDWKETKLPVEIPFSGDAEQFVMTPDGRAAAWETTESSDGGPTVQRVNVWRASQPKRVRSFKVDSDEAYTDASKLLLSPDGERVLVATANNGGNLAQMLVKVYDVDAGSPLHTLRRPGFRVSSFAWSPNGELVATGAGTGPGERATIWSMATGEALRRLDGPQDEVEQFSPDGRLLLTYGLDGFERVYEVATGKELCRFITRADGSWVVADPEGRFDASDLDEIQGVHWLAPDDPLKPLPLEIFMRDYYEPRLLARILSGERLAPVRALSEVNRAQPVVRIASVEQQPGRPELARVTVEVSRAEAVAADGARGSGVYDLRLFRDGQLVAYAPAPGGEVKTDARTGRAAVTFDDVRLPRPRLPAADARAGGKAEPQRVEFTAYAFNEDRVKSLTARAGLELKEPLAASKGRAYVVSVGVNAYENEAWDLRFAANDARRLQEVVAARVREGGEYEEVVGVPLISDYESEGGRKTRPRVVKETAATKRNFKAVLDLLAGREADAEALKSVPNADRLRRATPEDLILVSFSSHGYADERGRFFLFTSDTGDAGESSEMRDALGRAVSSDELGAWLRDVDAGELILVVDACHSAASVQGEGFKPGPMGSRGLGQLSYDKGMRILTSTQADDVALESALVEQGLLTYALTRDGLESARADFMPKDARITVAEWLAYGVERVPSLHAEVEKRLSELKAAGTSPAAAATGLGGDEGARVVVLTPGGAADGGRGLRLKVSGQSTRTQQPALFDFARRRRDAVLARSR
jgi:WD40 repeat protein